MLVYVFCLESGKLVYFFPSLIENYRRVCHHEANIVFFEEVYLVSCCFSFIDSG